MVITSMNSYNLKNCMIEHIVWWTNNNSVSILLHSYVNIPKWPGFCI